MNILFVHPNMPGQFLRLAPHLARGHRVAFLTTRGDREIPGIGRILYSVPPPTEAERGAHGYVHAFQDAVRHGVQAARALRSAMAKGYSPDLVIAHSGWGDPLFVKDIAPDATVVIAGGDGVSYGSAPPEHASWREAMDAEVEYDRSRLIFLPHLPYHGFLKLLQLSAAHVYLTWPFVASWSLIEAMSCGGAVVGSD